MTDKITSRIPGFFRKTIAERQRHIAEMSNLNSTDLHTLSEGSSFSTAQANNMVENVIGIYTLPLAIATNFLINQRNYLIPMVIEEPSVVAAVSNAARLFRNSGGFETSSDPPIMIGQIQVLDIPDITRAVTKIQENKAKLIDTANKIGGSIVRRGGGATDIEIRIFEDTPLGPMVVLHLLMDTRDAMGANAINTAVEAISPQVEQLSRGRVNLRILSNLTDQRKARAQGVILSKDLATETLNGEDAVRAIVEAGIFAEVDPYRAATHNKGIMNGIDAVVIATGNDWRAVEAGAHAFAARSGSYRSLTQWWQDDDGNLRGSIELPLAVGIVGGATRVHPTAKLALKILNVQTAQELSEVMAAVGLAQNLAAIRALATEGIQRGHMRMHARQLAAAAGATAEQVPVIAAQLIEEKNIRLERAKQIVQKLTERSEQ